MLVSLVIHAQKYDTKDAFSNKQKQALGQSFNINLGLDFSQVLNINPRPGSGASSLSLGTRIKSKYLYYDYTQQLEAQVLFDFGVFYNNSDSTDNKALRKSSDRFEFLLKYITRNSYTSKIYYALYAESFTQIANAYEGNYLTQIGNSKKLSGFLTPINNQISLGVEVKTDTPENFFMYSPISLKHIYVNDINIAQDSVYFDEDDMRYYSLHGNDIDPEFTQSKLQLGSYLRVARKIQTSDYRFSYSTNMSLYYNYLELHPIPDINWENILSINIKQSLSLSFILNVFYDNDVLLQRSSDGSVRNSNQKYDRNKFSIQNRIFINMNHTFK